MGASFCIVDTAAFVDAHTLEILPRDGSASFQVTARSFCLTTGSVASVPPIAGLAETGFWTSDDILDAAALPQRFAVLGGGAIALEMAHYLEAMGRQVTLIQRSAQFLTGTDRECSAVIEKAYTQRGITCHLGTKIQQVSQHESGKRLDYLHGGEARQLDVDEILLAMGREPATAGLQFEAAGVLLDGKKDPGAADDADHAAAHLCGWGCLQSLGCRPHRHPAGRDCRTQCSTAFAR